MCHGDTYISKPQQKKIFCYKKIFRYKKIFASPIICYNQYRSLSISQKSVINIDKDGCQLRRRSAMGRLPRELKKSIKKKRWDPIRCSSSRCWTRTRRTKNLPLENPRGFLRIRFPRKDNNTLHHGYMDMDILQHAYCMKCIMITTLKMICSSWRITKLYKFPEETLVDVIAHTG